jgi:hypothetical protein
MNNSSVDQVPYRDSGIISYSSETAKPEHNWLRRLYKRWSDFNWTVELYISSVYGVKIKLTPALFVMNETPIYFVIHWDEMVWFANRLASEDGYSKVILPQGKDKEPAIIDGRYVRSLKKLVAELADQYMQNQNKDT